VIEGIVLTGIVGDEEIEKPVVVIIGPLANLRLPESVAMMPLVILVRPLSLFR
jgi:hypothetical protein